MPDESTYIFDEPQGFQPKGISSNIHVLEVKHHFLPTDWTDGLEISARGRTLLMPDETDPDLLNDAYMMNPTNAWLGEECIRADLLKEQNNLKEKDKENKKIRKNAFKRARQIAGYLTSGEHQDPGTLLVQGLVEGECGDLSLEQAKYKQAIILSPNLPEPYWYLALSISYEIDDELKNDLNKSISDLNKDQIERVDEILKNFRLAKERSYQSAWIDFDYGCELIRWAENDSKRSQGIKEIVSAYNYLSSSIRNASELITDAIENERYLSKVMDDRRIQALLVK